MRKNSMIITVCLVICAFMAGCSGGQTSRISHLIENQANIDSVRIAEVDGPNEVMYIRLEDPAKIAAVINSVNGVHVKRLSAAQDNEFMQERILERHRTIEFCASNADRSMQGWVMVWPDGSVYAVDIETMAGSNRTVSYLSETKYPEVYNELL